MVAAVMLDLLEVTDWAGDWAVVDWAATAVEGLEQLPRKSDDELREAVVRV